MLLVHRSLIKIRVFDYPPVIRIVRLRRGEFVARLYVQEASFRRQISMNCGIPSQHQGPQLTIKSRNRLELTFLISATSRGILAVFEGIVEGVEGR